MSNTTQHTIWSACCYDDKPHYVKHYGESMFFLNEIETSKTFDTLRQDLFLESHRSSGRSKGELNAFYIETRNGLKSKNAELRTFFRLNNTIPLYMLLEKEKCVSFTENAPKAFNVKIEDARYLIYDGNCVELLATGVNGKYYFFTFSC